MQLKSVEYRFYYAFYYERCVILMFRTTCHLTFDPELNHVFFLCGRFHSKVSRGL